MITDGSTVVIDLTDGGSRDNIECPSCRETRHMKDWSANHGCAKCGYGTSSCPTDGCDGTLHVYF